jgi:DNA-binding LytR/AlgR family response regulator
MIKIAIVDDDISYANQLEEYLHRYEVDFSESFEITTYLDGDTIVENYHSQFDIIFMDVEMRFMDGMSAAEEIRKIDKEVVIIFITNMPQYAIRGYAVEALDYILKPVTYFAFSQRLSRAISRMKKREQKSLVIPVKGGTVRLEVNTIHYIESQGHDIIYHTTMGEYVSTGTMKDLEESLKQLHFFRGSKWYLINLQQVEALGEGSAKLKGGKDVPLSRGRKKEFMEALAQYWGEVIK